MTSRKLLEGAAVALFFAGLLVALGYAVRMTAEGMEVAPRTATSGLTNE